VSGATGAGLDELRAALCALVAALPAPDVTADVRLWVDRAFTIKGAGTVVTGTLPAGTLRIDDELVLAPGGRRVTVRGLQSLGEPAESVPAVARVAVNLRGVPLEAVRRGHALLAPGAWLDTRVLDVRLHRAGLDSAGPTDTTADRLPRQVVLHAGAAAVPARVRPLGADTARVTLASGLPLRIGDRALLRDPGTRRIPAGVTVLDVRPPALRRRGAAVTRGAELSAMDGAADGGGELRRRGLVQRAELVAMGARPPAGAPEAAGWLVDPGVLAKRAVRLATAVAEHARANPLEPGMPLETARQVTQVPDARLVELLLGEGLTLREGRVQSGSRRAELPPVVRRAVDAVRAELAQRPFAAPETHRLAELGLGAKQLAAAARAGELLKVADGVYLLPGADVEAAGRLATLPAPFTLSQARQALDTTRRVAVPLMELLARQGLSRRLPDGTHELR
jgi:selenocysteine-specific elongation factor